MVYTPKQDFAATGRLGVKSQDAFERTADWQVEVGQPEGITTQLPPLAVMCQNRMDIRTRIGDHTGDMIALRRTNSSPGTDTPEMCMENRHRTRRGEPSDRSWQGQRSGGRDALLQRLDGERRNADQARRLQRSGLRSVVALRAADLIPCAAEKDVCLVARLPS